MSFGPGSSRFDLLSLSASRPVSSSRPRHPVLPGYPGLSPPRVPRSSARAAHTWRGRRGVGRVTHRGAGPGGSKSAGGSPPRPAARPERSVPRPLRSASVRPRSRSVPQPPRVPAAPRAAWRPPRPEPSGSCSRWSRRRWPRLSKVTVRRGPAAEVWGSRRAGDGEGDLRVAPRPDGAGRTYARMRQSCGVPGGDMGPGARVTERPPVARGLATPTWGSRSQSAGLCRCDPPVLPPSSRSCGGPRMWAPGGDR